LKQAFFDSMPFTWREPFAQAGHSSSAMTLLAQVLRYFRQQWNLAIHKQIENEKIQKNSKGFAARRDTKVNPSHKEDCDTRGSTKYFSRRNPSQKSARSLMLILAQFIMVHILGVIVVLIITASLIKNDFVVIIKAKKKVNLKSPPSLPVALTLQFIHRTKTKTKKTRK
jgi:hypothetical protein